jgi:RHS repeat-associated protein
VVTASYDAQDRMLTYGAASYTYTANGDLATKTAAGGTTTYAYDTLGNLLQVTRPSGMVVSYTVDGRGRRVRKAINGVPVQGWLYADQLRPIAELDGSGALVSRFVYGTRPNVPEYVVKNGQTYRIVSDHLGTPRVVGHATTGAVVQRLDVQAFGEVVQDTAPGWQPFGFAGGLYDPDTGLVRFGARDYDPQVGRWMAKDPVGFRGGDTNVYGYVGGNPSSLVDPSGLAVGDWWDLPANLKRAREIAVQELANRPLSHNDLGDAMRHAEWIRRTVVETNTFTAWLAGTGHEVEGLISGQPRGETIMDLHNNSVGRAAGRRGTAVDPRDLWTLPCKRTRYNPYACAQ